MSTRQSKRNFFKRKEDLLFFFGLLILVMRSCDRCSLLKKTCSLSEASEKCLICVADEKFCDLTMSFVKLRRVHKERLRVRDDVREAKAKLDRLKARLRSLKNEKEALMFSK